MAKNIVVGAGSTGTALARLLANSGDEVSLVTRSGTGPDEPNIERVKLDASDLEQLTELSKGARTIFQCAMPAYDRWPSEFPPLAEATLTAAERNGADYVMLGNAYAYGPVAGPIPADHPLRPVSVKGVVRQRMWELALAAHQRGNTRVTEVRAGDYVGAGAYSLLTLAILPAVLAEEPSAFPADLDSPHSWTYTGDAAQALAAASRTDQAWGRAWHAPSHIMSTNEIANLTARVAGVSPPKLRRMTLGELAVLGADNPVMAEVIEMSYMLDEEFMLESGPSEQALKVSATPMGIALRETIDAMG